MSYNNWCKKSDKNKTNNNINYILSVSILLFSPFLYFSLHFLMSFHFCFATQIAAKRKTVVRNDQPPVKD